MDAGLFLQYLIIALAVLTSAWVVARKQFPATLRRLRIAIAVPLLREGKPAWVRAIGGHIAPEARQTNGCGGCDGCK